MTEDLKDRPIANQTWQNGKWTTTTLMPGTPEHAEWLAILLSAEDEG